MLSLYAPRTLSSVVYRRWQTLHSRRRQVPRVSVTLDFKAPQCGQADLALFTISMSRAGRAGRRMDSSRAFCAIAWKMPAIVAAHKECCPLKPLNQDHVAQALTTPTCLDARWHEPAIHPFHTMTAAQGTDERSHLFDNRLLSHFRLAMKRSRNSRSL